MKSEFKKIAIICASERELAPFLPLIENPTISERAMLRIHEGRLNGFEVAAVYCGVCKVNAAAAAQIMIDCYGADTVISVYENTVLPRLFGACFGSESRSKTPCRARTADIFRAYRNR